ncbi:histone deacetylase 5-like [Pyrus ussuriensis x Pyrus communis]|uniref:Histone deacetylase 5-like n=1 Tax=Pyrus ussuriensis x Pyrus communis TaxID=2448454 RepID=A0A5N5G8J4_9ROSA|nr:histone deacetylase 5-like [Pyrus ussuriensis x Pyrus communis]
MASNTFITKLTEECNKCQDFIDRNASLRFKGDSIATHQILGPLFKDDVPKTITEMLKAHCLKPLFHGYDWLSLSRWSCNKMGRYGCDGVNQEETRSSSKEGCNYAAPLAKEITTPTPVMATTAMFAPSKQPRPKAETTEGSNHRLKKPFPQSKEESNNRLGGRGIKISFNNELLSLSALRILQRKGLNSVGKCLNDLAADGLLSNENVVHLSTVLERTRQYFTIFEKVIRTDDDLKATMVAHETIQPRLEAIKAKNEKLVNLDRQIAELHR